MNAGNNDRRQIMVEGGKELKVYKQVVGLVRLVLGLCSDK